MTGIKDLDIIFFKERRAHPSNKRKFLPKIITRNMHSSFPVEQTVKELAYLDRTVTKYHLAIILQRFFICHTKLCPRQNLELTSNLIVCRAKNEITVLQN